MNKTTLAAALLAVSLLSSCTTMIVRWPNGSPEMVSRDAELERRPDIFEDYLWTTPDIRSRAVKDRFPFGGHEYSFSVSGDSMTIGTADETKTVAISKSNKRYADVSSLKRVVVTKQRWVPRTSMEMETVPVQRTRTVTQTSFDAKGNAHTSMHTEFYTDWEHRMVPKTRWVWENYQDSWFEIPQSEYFDASFANGDHFTIYRARAGSETKYLLQNPQYYIVHETEEPSFGAKDLKILFVDTQSNGAYFEDSDRLLFNVWNPYDKSSSYRQIRNVMDNYWYEASYVSDNYFLAFARVGDRLGIRYANEEYVSSKAEGTLTINGLTEKGSTVMVNGHKYWMQDAKPAAIEYGRYRLVIHVPGRIDYEESFVVDGNNPAKTVSLPRTAAAETVKIANIFSENFKVTAENGDWKTVRFNAKELSVPLGKTRITVSLGGYELTREIDVVAGQPATIDFEREISAK